MTKPSRMRIERVSSASELFALGKGWNALDRGVPFRSYQWLESWWQAYGAESGGQLLVLAIFDHADQLVGVAPWYCLQVNGRNVIRFLGSGAVCSDYLTILCREGCEADVTLALADWLLPLPGDADREPFDWETLDLVGVDHEDVVVAQLLVCLAERGALAHCRDRSSCWRVKLPTTWSAYLASLSKSHRKQIRRLERDYFQTGRARLHVAETAAELVHGLELLVDLHQRRRESLGETGSFSSTQFSVFHHFAAGQLLAAGRLRLVWLNVDGQTVAVEYQVLGRDVVYAYQSGIEPRALEHQPGRLITIATLQQAIAEGRDSFDFLRGDESYKAHWRAKPRQTLDIRVVSPAPGALLRHGLWLAGDSVKSWIKMSLEFSGILTH